jgi:predicted component of type VI protein secretion system
MPNMPAQLMALTDGPSILLDKPILLMGRHPECDIQLNSRKVSRRHCCIAQVQDYLVVRDLGSTNGIRINGNRVLEGRLNAGDELTIGNFKYQICWDMPGEPAPRPRPTKPAPAPAASPILSKPVDQLLEDADEPIPLDDEIAASRILTAKAAPKEPIPAGTISGDELQEVLPEDLSLIPPSGSAQPSS